jgi:hypothetical protein
MAVDRRSDSHRSGNGDAADSGIPGVFGWLAFFLKHAAKNQVHGTLRVGGSMNDKPVTRLPKAWKRLETPASAFDKC